MITAIEGKNGDGATHFMAKLVKDRMVDEGKIVKSPLKLKFDHEELTNGDVPKILQSGENGIILALDYPYELVDCRSSQSIKNKMFAYLCSQAKLRNMDIFFTVDKISNCDVRIRQSIDSTIHIARISVDDLRIIAMSLRTANIYRGQMKLSSMTNLVEAKISKFELPDSLFESYLVKDEEDPEEEV